MKYYVQDTDETFNTIDDVLDYCIDDEYHDMHDDDFEDWVNDAYSGADIAGNYYYPYDILDHFGDLGEVESRYQEEMNDSDRENAEYELRNAHVGQTVYIQRYSVEIIEDDEETEENNDEEDFIEQTRMFYEEQSCLEKYKNEREKDEEDELMKMFQVIS